MVGVRIPTKGWKNTFQTKRQGGGQGNHTQTANHAPINKSITLNKKFKM